MFSCTIAFFVIRFFDFRFRFLFLIRFWIFFGFQTRISFAMQVHNNALGMFIMFYYVYYVVDVVWPGLCRAHLTVFFHVGIPCKV